MTDAEDRTQRAARYVQMAADLERCVAEGDLAGFQRLIYEDGAEKKLRPEAARVLRDGFRLGVLGETVYHRSFVCTCMAEKRPELVYEVMACARASFARQERPKEDEPGFLRDWFAQLCSARRGDQSEFVSPPSLVRQMTGELTEYREFIIMTIEYLPDDHALERARRRDDQESQAFFRECEMALRIRQGAASADASASSAPPLRPNRRSL